MQVAAGRLRMGKTAPRLLTCGRQRAAWGTFPTAGPHVPPSALQEPVCGDDSFL